MISRGTQTDITSDGAIPDETCSQCRPLRIKAEHAYQLTLAQIRLRFIVQRNEEFQRYWQHVERTGSDSPSNSIGDSFDPSMVAQDAQAHGANTLSNINCSRHHAIGCQAISCQWELGMRERCLPRKLGQPQQAPAGATPETCNKWQKEQAQLVADETLALLDVEHQVELLKIDQDEINATAAAKADCDWDVQQQMCLHCATAMNRPSSSRSET